MSTYNNSKTTNVYTDDKTTGGTAWNWNDHAFYHPEFCQYRLPCGYCERLGRDCPKVAYTYTATSIYTPKLDPTCEVNTK